jgi:hypothetical protein
MTLPYVYPTKLSYYSYTKTNLHGYGTSVGLRHCRGLTFCAILKVCFCGVGGRGGRGNPLPGTVQGSDLLVLRPVAGR